MLSIVAMLLPLSAVSLLPLAARGEPPAPPPSYYWKWSDGQTSQNRTLHEPPTGLPPAIVVTASPARSGRLVELQYRSPAGWRTEDSARTDTRGTARLQVNPYCQDGAWCRAEFAYRMRVDGRSATIRIRFVPALSPAETGTS